MTLNGTTFLWLNSASELLHTKIAHGGWLWNNRSNLETLRLIDKILSNLTSVPCRKSYGKLTDHNKTRDQWGMMKAGNESTNASFPKTFWIWISSLFSRKKTGHKFKSGLISDSALLSGSKSWFMSQSYQKWFNALEQSRSSKQLKWFICIS